MNQIPASLDDLWFVVSAHEAFPDCNFALATSVDGFHLTILRDRTEIGYVRRWTGEGNTVGESEHATHRDSLLFSGLATSNDAAVPYEYLTDICNDCQERDSDDTHGRT